MPDLQITDLRCEYETAPLGLGVAKPRLSWKLASDRRGARQVAYQVLAGTAEGQANLWDSGKVESDQSTFVEYAGTALISRQRVYWLVKVWDETGAETVSESTFWEIGLLERTDWRAEWIGSEIVGGPKEIPPVPFVRGIFVTHKQISRARLYVTALGLYEFYINGQRVGADYFTPGWTHYGKRVQYQVYDVSEFIGQGLNAAGAILGDGWYCGHFGWKDRQYYGDRPKLLAQIEIDYEDGSRQIVVSDSTWKTSTGPILASDMLMGEQYDARKELAGWASPDNDALNWTPITVFPDPGTPLTAMQGPPVRITEEISPITEPVYLEPESGPVWIYDLGQNMVGWARIKVNGPAGTVVTLRFAEVLNPDGSIYITNLRAAKATDTYILKGEADEEWEPRFTFHGFRYVEISGLKPVSITGVVLHSDTPWSGEFSCSDPLVTQLQKNITWGQRGNFFEVPTDCPQRDERLGWTGDAQVFIRTACFNMNVAPFFHKWMQDVRDSQYESGAIPMVVPDEAGTQAVFQDGADGGPAWSDAAVICPWTIYLCYGDKRILEDNYVMMARYVDQLEAKSVNLIRSHPDLTGHLGFGDWLSINADTAQDLIGTAFFAHCAKLLSKIAGLIGKTDGEQHYADLNERVKKAFQRRFLTEDGLLVTPSQTACLLALHFDVVPQDRREGILKVLVRDIKNRGNKLSTGFVGSPYINLVLTDYGRNDVAYDLLAQKQWPSWLYAVTQGATTIWERWDGWTHDKGFQDPGMNSFNHYAYGAIGAWLYSTVAGIEIDPEQPGYKNTILRPQPGGDLTWASASLETEFGRISSAWTREEGRIKWTVTVPPNTTATAYVPTTEAASVTEDGKPMEGRPIYIRGAVVRKLEPGTYEFEAALTQ